MEFFPAKVFANMSNPVPEPYAALLGAVLAGMCTAMAAHTTTSTTSTGSATSSSAEYTIAELRQLGYGVDNVTTPGSLIVSWNY